MQIRTCLRRVVCGLAFTVSLIALVLPARAGFRLGNQVVPVSQSVRLNLDARQPEYTGQVRIELRVREKTDRFAFHARNMELKSVRFERDGQTIPLTIEEGDEGLRTAVASSSLETGAYTLDIEFAKAFNTKAVGLYRMTHEGQGYLFTQFEDIDARRAFPCWDEPIYKIPWQLTITVPTQQVAVTNTPIERERIGADTHTYHFAKTPPMPSYLVAIAAGPLESIAIPGLSVPGRIYTVKGQKKLARLATRYAPPILSALEEYFGRKYPYRKLDLIAIPEYWPGAMENPGAITYSDRILLVDEATASVAQKRSIARVTAHEFAHLWFGDLVTMAWWDDLWLNESFADWLGDKTADALYPDYGVQIAELQSVQRLMGSDARPSTVPVRKPVTSTADIMDGLGLAYGKGKTILQMVEKWIGEDVFREGVQRYIEAHAWGNTTADDLFAALSAAADRDLTPVLSSFLEQPGYPVVTVGNEGNGTVRITQRRFLNYGVDAEPETWTIPVRLKVFDGQKTHTRVVLLDRETRVVELGSAVEWVLPQQGAYGYYRWSAPPQMIFAMARDAERHLDERERAVFMANLGALLDSGELGGDDYLTVLGSLAGSARPEVIEGVMSALGNVSGAFVTDALRPAFAKYVRQTLAPALDRYGMEPREGEDEAIGLLRPRLIRWLGDSGRDEAVRERCRRWAAQYAEDPASVDAAIAGTALMIAAIDGDRAQFEAYRKKFEAASEPSERGRYLRAMSYFDDTELQNEALAYAFSGKVRPNEMFSIIGGIGRTTEGGERVMDWMMENYAMITERVPEPMLAYMPYFAGGCSRERLETARVFFEDPAHSVPGTMRTFEKVSDQVMDCVSLREREGARVAEYLRGLGAP